ncbi:unnamed protein product, partial [Cyprideis torosa]
MVARKRKQICTLCKGKCLPRNHKRTTCPLLKSGARGISGTERCGGLEHTEPVALAGADVAIGSDLLDGEHAMNEAVAEAGGGVPVGSDSLENGDGSANEPVSQSAAGAPGAHLLYDGGPMN